MKRLFIMFASLLLAGALAQQGAAANLVPNPGFEETGGPIFSCITPVCFWSSGNGTATLQRDTTISFAGSASLKVIPTGPGFGDAQSACFPASPGMYSMSFWSTFWDTTIGSTRGGVSFFSDASCSTFVPGQGVQSWTNFTRDPASSPQWRESGGSANAPNGTVAAYVYLETGCTTAECSGAGSAHFDEVSLVQNAATAVTLRSFSAARSAGGMSLRWRTASEVDTLGFDVYREAQGKRVRINRKLVPAANAGMGRLYSYLDGKPSTGKTLRYWLQAVNLDGSRQWYGPATASKRPGA